MTSLREISDQHKELMGLIESDDLDEAIADTMEAIEGEFEEKAKSLKIVSDNIKSDIDILDAEIKRLQERKKVAENRYKSMIEYLRLNMEFTGIKKIQHPLFTITLRAGRKIVEIENEESLPDECVVVSTSVKPDKRRIEKLLKEGEDVPGAKLVDSKSAILIK